MELTQKLNSSSDNAFSVVRFWQNTTFPCCLHLLGRRGTIHYFLFLSVFSLSLGFGNRIWRPLKLFPKFGTLFS